MTTYNEFMEACGGRMKKIEKKIDKLIKKDAEVHDKIDEEHLEEISKDAKVEYMKASTKSAATILMRNKGKMRMGDDDFRRLRNRARGMYHASHNKKEDWPLRKEEVEQVDELSKGALYNYTKAGANDRDQKLNKALKLAKSSAILRNTGNVRGGKKFGDESKRLVRKSRDRGNWIERAKEKLKEEIISELSDKTLKSYIKKSVADAAHAYSKYNPSADSRNMIKGKVTAKDIENADSIAKRWRNRKQGIYLAKKKMTESIHPNDIKDRKFKYQDSVADHADSIPGSDRNRAKANLEHNKKKYDQIRDLKKAQDSPRGSEERKKYIEKAKNDRNGPAHYEGGDTRVNKNHYLKSKGRLSNVANHALKTFNKFIHRGD